MRKPKRSEEPVQPDESVLRHPVQTEVVLMTECTTCSQEMDTKKYAEASGGDYPLQYMEALPVEDESVFLGFKCPRCGHVVSVKVEE